MAESKKLKEHYNQPKQHHPKKLPAQDVQAAFLAGKILYYINMMTQKLSGKMR